MRPKSLMPLKQSRCLCLSRSWQTKMGASLGGCHAPLRSALQKAQLHQIGLDYIHNRIGFLTDRGRNRIQAHWAAAIFFDNGAQHASIELVATEAAVVRAVRQQTRRDTTIVATRKPSTR